MIALRRDERLEEAGPQLSGLEVLERLFTECRELASWLEGKGFDVEGILEEGEELLDSALWLYWLLRDVLAGNCKLTDAQRGREGARAGMQKRCALNACTATLRVVWRSTRERQ